MFSLFSTGLLSRRRPTPSRRRHPARPQLEALEGRCVPAVANAFNSVTGALTITGDAAANHITVTENGAVRGSYRVAATDGISRGASSFTGVKSITINTLGGGDTVTLAGNPSALSSLTGALVVTAAGGLGVTFLNDFNVVGPVAVATTAAAGDLSVAAASPATNVTLGPTSITNAGGGNTTVALRGAHDDEIAVAGGLSLRMGSGANLVELQQVAVAAGLTEFGAGASDDLFFDHVHVGGFLSVNGTAAASRVGVNLINSTIGVFFSVASGGGNDVVALDNTAVLGLGLQPQQQTFGVNLRGGRNASRIGTSGPSERNVIHGSLFHFGDGDETFDLRNYTVTSFVTVNATGGGGTTVTLRDSKVSGFLSLATSQVPDFTDDKITISGLTIGQNFAMDLGPGFNFIEVTNCTYLGSFSAVDVGLDFVTFTGNSGFGDVTFASVSLHIDPGAFQNNQIAGNARFTSTGTNSADRINLGAAVGTVPSAANVLSVGKALAITLAAGQQGPVGQMDVVALNNVLIKGGLVVALAASADETVTITNSSVGGDLTVSGGASSTALTVNLGSTATANTGATRVVGNLAVATGSGNDTVALVDVSVFGTTGVTTNAGIDTVSLEGGSGFGETPGAAGPSEFFGTVAVSTGDGTDRVNVGADAADRARFFGTVVFDGGDGEDLVFEVAPQYHGGSPTLISITSAPP
jgi:hypothetical protein